MGKFNSKMEKVVTLCSDVIEDQNLETILRTALEKEQDPKRKEDIDKILQKIYAARTAHQDYEKNKKVTEPKRCLVLDPLSSPATRTFLECLKQRLREHKIQMVKVQNGTTEAETVFLVCNNVSRLGTDITNTLLRVSRNVYNKMVILVLHCKTESNLPQISAKQQLSEYTDVDFVDVAFDMERKDIYDCDMNKTAFKALWGLLNGGHVADEKALTNKATAAENDIFLF